MATANSTNMLDLIEDVRSHIKDEIKPNGSLPSLKKIYFGPIINPSIFPCIAIVPIEERVAGFTSGNVHNIRKIRIEVITQKKDSKTSMRQAIGIQEQVKNIFKVNAADYQIPDRQSGGINTAVDVEMVLFDSSDKPVPYRNGFLHTAALEFDVHSYDNPTPDITGNRVGTCATSGTDTKTLMDKIIEILKAQRIGPGAILSNVKQLRSFALPPNPVYPIIFVDIVQEVRTHKFTGMDSVKRDIAVNVFTKMKDKQLALKRNVLMADKARQTLFSNADFNGSVYNVDYRGIVYGQLTAGAELLFGSSVQFEADSWEVLAAA